MRFYRISCPEVLSKESVLRNFTKFTRKHLCQSLFLITLQASITFSCEFYEISKNTFSYRIAPVAAPGFRKGRKAQHALNHSLKSGATMQIGDVCLKHHLITFQKLLFVYCAIYLLSSCMHGFDMKALDFIYDYLGNRKQRKKIDNAYGSWQNMLYGVSQGSILGPLLQTYAISFS